LRSTQRLGAGACAATVQSIAPVEVIPPSSVGQSRQVFQAWRAAGPLP